MHGTILTPDQEQELARHRVARLATVDAAGRPHVVPVCFALLDGRVYTPLDRKPKRVPVERLRRVRDLAANPRVCLTVDYYDEDWTRLRWLQVRGEGAVVLPGDEQRRALVALRARYPQYERMDLDDAPIIRVTPSRIVRWAWGRPTG